MAVTPTTGVPMLTGVGWVYQYALCSRKDNRWLTFGSLQDWTIRYRHCQAEWVGSASVGASSSNTYYVDPNRLNR